MNKFHKIIITIIGGLTIGGIVVFAFNNPSGNPPYGGGAIGVGTDAPASSLYIKSDGKVGIGTTDPGTSKLKVVGTIESSSGGFKFPDATTQTTAATTGTNYWTLSSSSLYPNQTSYNLGVGTASLDANYKITTSGGGIKAESTSQPAGYFSSASGYGLIVNSGNVGIGIATPGALLDVQGAAQFGSGNVNLIDSTGKIAGISSTYFASLDGSTITGLNASNLGSGTVPSARVSGSYTGITGVGTLTAGTWNAAAIDNAYITSASTWNAKEPGISAGTTAQYWRGDKTWQTMPAASALSCTTVSNTSTYVCTASCASDYVIVFGRCISNVAGSFTGNFSGNAWVCPNANDQFWMNCYARCCKT